MFSPRDYWPSLAKDYGLVDAVGYAPILHPNAPIWFNQVVDHLQFTAFRRALAVADVSPGARCLDVGCGTGRWIRRYLELGSSPVGLDATIEMLQIARAHRTDTPLVAGLAYDLPFPNAVFDLLSDITVVQHIPYELQAKAMHEMVRVLRPGGRLILLELLRGQDSHIFPRQTKEWIREVESCGATLLKCFGQEFFFLDRLLVRFAHILSRQKGKSAVGARSAMPPASPADSAARRLYWNVRRMTVFLSAVTEPILTTVCPVSLATHALFVFRKNP
jgi:SAM-dependent methyltransferase